jgi:hypothetical protein
MRTGSNSSAFQAIAEACENEIPYEREHFTPPADLLEAPQ